MAELYTFLDGAIADIRAKMDQEYQRRMAEHEARMSTELSAEDYTANYGKIDVVKALSYFYENSSRHGYPPAIPSACKPHLQTWVSGQQRQTPVSDATHPDGRWIVHSVPITSKNTYYDGGGMRTSYRLSVILIDNYGQSYVAQCTETTGNFHVATAFTLDYKAAQPHTYSHRLPNVLIDYCKTLRVDPWDRDYNLCDRPTVAFDLKLNALQTLAAHYYRRFTAMKPLFTSGRFAEYATLLAEKTAVEERLRASEAARTDAEAKATAAAQKATEREAALQAKLSSFHAELNDAREELRLLKGAHGETTAAHSKQIAMIKGLASRVGVPEPTVEPLRAILTRYEEQAAALQKTTRDLTAATKQLEQLRAENQRYVDQVFAQRQEITGYKKQLLEQPQPAAGPNIEELIARAVARMMPQPQEPPCPVAFAPSIEITDVSPKNPPTE